MQTTRPGLHQHSMATSTLCMIPTSREHSCRETPWKMKYLNTTESTTHPNMIFSPRYPRSNKYT